MEKILIIGGSDSLKLELEQSLILLGEVSFINFVFDEKFCKERISNLLEFYSPSIIVNLLEEKNEFETNNLQKVNEYFPGVVAKWCYENDTLLIHLSTNQVFSYTNGVKFSEIDEPKPDNLYGMSKLMGERKILSHTKHCLILRLPHLTGLNNFNFEKNINIVTEDLFSSLLILILKKYFSITEKFLYGVFHFQLITKKIENFCEKKEENANEVFYNGVFQKNKIKINTCNIGGDLDCSKFERNFNVKIPMVENLIAILKK